MSKCHILIRIFKFSPNWSFLCSFLWLKKYRQVDTWWCTLSIIDIELERLLLGYISLIYLGPSRSVIHWLVASVAFSRYVKRLQWWVYDCKRDRLEPSHGQVGLWRLWHCHYHYRLPCLVCDGRTTLSATTTFIFWYLRKNVFWLDRVMKCITITYESTKFFEFQYTHNNAHLFLCQL